MKIKNKFIVTLILVVLICTFFYSSSVQAFSINGYRYLYDEPNWLFDFGNLAGIEEGQEPPTYYFQVNDLQDWSVLRYTPSDTIRLQIVGETETTYEVAFFDLLGNRVQYYIWGGRDGNLDHVMTCFQNELTDETFTINKTFKEKNDYYFKGKIYNSDGTIFFPEPPLTLGRIMAITLKETQVTETMKAMITGFLKYLIALVISVLAFWKGWQFLSKNFKKA